MRNESMMPRNAGSNHVSLRPICFITPKSLLPHNFETLREA